MFDLSPRLQAAFEYVEYGAAVADIGTDHAFLPVALVKSGKVRNAIACDINEKPLANAKKTLELVGLKNDISLRLSDGLSEVCENEVDTVIIAGMGGEVISGIIDRTKWLKNNKHLILQPMTCPEEVRKYLSENGFEILSETAVSDAGKVYAVISARYSGAPKKCDFAYYVTGKIDAKTEGGRKYLKKQLRRFSALSHDLCNIPEKTEEKEQADSVVLKINRLLEEH